jgi:poly-gamma-glutamate synthesis protein (capsule biosynthesis protein)
VVVQLHWGYEWSMYPLRSQRDLARSYVEAGAHLVVCHHAHVPMGVEVWRDGAIAHGLGNLHFGGSKSGHHPFRHASFVLRAGLSRSGITDLEVIPVATDEAGRTGPASGRQAELIEDAVTYLSRPARSRRVPRAGRRLGRLPSGLRRAGGPGPPRLGRRPARRP